MKPAAGQFDDASDEEDISFFYPLSVAAPPAVQPFRRSVPTAPKQESTQRKPVTTTSAETKHSHTHGKKVDNKCFKNIVIDVNDNDVLCGRGKGANDHIGNQRFRDIVKEYRYAYHTSKDRREKANICREIIGRVRNQTPKGRFLKKEKMDNGQDIWLVIDEGKTMLKTGQALREGRSICRAQMSAIIPTSHGFGAVIK